jgi:NADH-quinone oxidoreductase subunit C
MTLAISGQNIVDMLTTRFPDSIMASDALSVAVKLEQVFTIMEHLKTSVDYDFNYLTDLTAVDYYEYFEIVYRITSLTHNHMAVIKTRCYNRNNPICPSVTGLWKGADYFEREIFDLFGITFSGHPNMKRIFLWEGFEGYPLRKDYL